MAGDGAAILWVVPSERHVERWAREGRTVETRARLRGRLFDSLVGDRVLATAVEARIALAEALPAVAERDPLLAALARGDAWERTLDSLDAALGVLRGAGVRAESLARVARDRGGAAGGRARMLHDVLRAADAVLDARGLVNPRSVGSLLAERLASQPPTRVLAAVGAGSVVARFVLDWDGADAAWWRALDVALVRAGGRGARVELPSFDREDAPIDATRERDPLDVVIEDVARALDAPPATVTIDAPLGDLRLIGAVPEAARARIELRAATDAEAQARAVVDAVRRALLAGAGVEEIAIAGARFDETAIGALRRAFDDARIPLHDARGDSPAESGIVSFALGALALGDRGLGRRDVASLARARYLSASHLGVDSRALTELAHALERTPTAAASDPRGALEATALASSDDAARAEARAALAVKLADIVLRASRPATRHEHVATARAVLADLGVDPLRSRAARASLASDEPPRGIARAELRAMARDAHGWELLHAALSDYEAAVARLGLARAVVAPSAFRHELARTLDARAGRPGAARAGAVRVAKLGELADERLALLVVLDANDGALPSRGDGDPLLHDALASALRAIDPTRAPVPTPVRASRELASLALAASSARAIVFTRRARDDDGAAMSPAPIAAWLERGGVPSTVWRASPLDGPAVSEAEARLRHATPAPSAARRARIERAREARFEVASAPSDPILGDLDAAGAIASRLEAALVTDTGGADRPLAITNLEKLATCGFQGYAAQVLRARPVRPLREVPDARESGTLVHAALAAAFTETVALWSERPRDAASIRARALEAAERVISAHAVASALRRLSLARVRDAVIAVVEWSLADEEWDFARAEQPFGDARGAQGWPALVLDDGATRVALRGTIDRVDLGHGRAAVRAIDYKLSKGSAEAGMRKLGDTAFQVALYARAAADATRSRERAGLYVPSARPDDVGAKLKRDFEAKWTALQEARGSVTVVEASALAVVRRVRLGAIAPRPSDEAACTNCDMSGGCRKPRFAIAAAEEENDGGVA